MSSKYDGAPPGFIPQWESDPGCEELLKVAHEALQAIHDNCGKVCDDFENCTHLACDSSYESWAIADDALLGGFELSEQLERVTRQRDMWHRLFNRMDGAINHHRRETEKLFTNTHDEALYAARRRIYEEAARQGKEERERDSG